MKMLNSYWYVVAVGAIFTTTFILLGGGAVAGTIYIAGLTFCWAMERKIANMWRGTAYNLLEDK